MELYGVSPRSHLAAGSATGEKALTRHTRVFLQGDVKMYKMILLGQMEAEVQRLRALPRGTGAPIVQ